jgi:hypothetical protein
MNIFQIVIALIILTAPVSFAERLVDRSYDLSSEKEYREYYSAIRNAEDLIAAEKWEDAVLVYRQLFERYDFTFLRDCKIAAQVAAHVHKNDDAIAFIEEGIKNGWSLKSARKDKLLKSQIQRSEWLAITAVSDSLSDIFKSRLDPVTRRVIKKMYHRDQRMAFGALFTFSSKGQDRYAEKRFAPHSQKQLEKLGNIIDSLGFPGEKMIGNGSWASVILLHHNSISQKYVLQDSLYPKLRPTLLLSLQQGQIHPYRFALIEDWYVAVKSAHTQTAYGCLQTELTRDQLTHVNKLRKEIGLHRIETRNKLIKLQKRTGIDFYLSEGQRL